MIEQHKSFTIPLGESSATISMPWPMTDGQIQCLVSFVSYLTLCNEETKKAKANERHTEKSVDHQTKK